MAFDPDNSAYDDPNYREIIDGYVDGLPDDGFLDLPDDDLLLDPDGVYDGIYDGYYGDEV